MAMNRLIIATAAVASLASSALAQSDPAAQRGKALFMTRGCYQCHGTVGQGSTATGPALAPNPVPMVAFKKELRTPRAVMPAYSLAILPDEQVGDLYAYLKSIPVGRGPEQIPLLASGEPPGPVGDVAHGQAVYAVNCASCHGAALEGGTAKALRGEGAAHSGPFVEGLIKAPPAGMPKLYPASLSEADVQAVAAYVRQAK